VTYILPDLAAFPPKWPIKTKNLRAAAGTKRGEPGKSVKGGWWRDDRRPPPQKVQGKSELPKNYLTSTGLQRTQQPFRAKDELLAKDVKGGERKPNRATGRKASNKPVGIRSLRSRIEEDSRITSKRMQTRKKNAKKKKKRKTP